MKCACASCSAALSHELVSALKKDFFALAPTVPRAFRCATSRDARGAGRRGARAARRATCRATSRWRDCVSGRIVRDDASVLVGRSVGRSVGGRAVERSSGTVTPPSAGGVFALTRDGDGARSRAMRFFRIKGGICVDRCGGRPRSTSSSSRRRLDVRRAERGQHDGQHDDGVDEARGERDDDEGCELCEEDDGTSEQACRGGDG